MTVKPRTLAALIAGKPFAMIEAYCRQRGYPLPVAEYRFHPTRRWRFDAAIVSDKIGIEVDGAVYFAGRHTRGTGFESDAEKLSEAAVLGWRVLRCSTGQLKRGLMWGYLDRIFGKETQ